jgi:hypothetical protein
MTFYVKRHDTRAPYVASLRSDGAAIDLSACNYVKLLMRKQSAFDDTDNPKVSGTCSVINAGSGIVSYTWGASDLDTTDDYYVEFEIHWNDGGIQTVPNSTYNELIVVEDLDLA